MTTREKQTIRLSIIIKEALALKNKLENQIKVLLENSHGAAEIARLKRENELMRDALGAAQARQQARDAKEKGD